MNKIAMENDLNIFAESAGVFATDGASASENAVEALKRYNIDISGHTSQPITADLLAQSDLILTMTSAHKQLLERYAPGRVFTLFEYIGEEGEIPDPYGGDLEEYSETAEAIYDALTALAEKLADETLLPLADEDAPPKDDEA